MIVVELWMMFEKHWPILLIGIVLKFLFETQCYMYYSFIIIQGTMQGMKQ